MSRKSIGFKIGVVTFSLHFVLVALASIAFFTAHSSTAGLVFLPFLVLDAPLVPLISIFQEPVIIFGVLGSLMWFIIPWLTDCLLIRVFPRCSPEGRYLTVLITIVLVIVGCVPLSILWQSHSTKARRPVELQKSLNSPTSGYLTERVVFDDQSLGSISCIVRGSYRRAADPETLFVFHRGAGFFNNDYEEQHRILFADGHFKTVDPIPADDAHDCRFLVYKFMTYAALLDSDGKEIWRIAKEADTRARGVRVDGVQGGDIDGDGQSEYAIYFRYPDGITLVNETAETLWSHPATSIGHLEMQDVRGNGREEIFYGESDGSRFRALNASGTVVDTLNISTHTRQGRVFELVRWPVSTGQPNILLPEENRIRIVDMAGNLLMHLDAPGCRTYGKMNAVAVKFRRDAPACLAVRKILIPDLAVLYVYDANGTLVFQTTEAIKGSMLPALSAVPGDKYGTERLLVGRAQGVGEKVIEYSLAEQEPSDVPDR